MRLVLYFLSWLSVAVIAAADDSLRVEQLDISAQFVVSLISDGDGGAFIGTEDHGVFHYQSDGSVTKYTTNDSLGDDNAYALTIDKLGRLWVGHLNTGVSVFNGEAWRNYDVIDGPIGERIFDLQTCPVDGDVWLATSAGITRYKSESDSWEHFTREDGLLEDQAASLAFKSDGTLVVGTQCHGLAVFTRNKNGEYKHTKDITAPERFGLNNCSPVPLTPFGTGLPTNQINQVLVARDGVIWIATPTGLVRSDSSLKTMTYVRGIDYADKVRGLYGGAPKDWQEYPPEVMETLLPEDYITCLAEDAGGAIWIGTRRKGFMAIDPKTGRRGTGDKKSLGLVDNYISAILPMPDSRPLLGLYIGGVVRPNRELALSAAKKTRTVNAAVNTIAKSDFAPLPSPIKPPPIEELKAMQAKLEKLGKPLPKVYAAYYGEDWKTQGDWVGRYGRQYAVMCAANSPFDHCFYYNEEFFKVRGFIGPHRKDGDTIRRWAHWIKTDNPRALYTPLAAYRRQAEWDDHGETYPLTIDGPDLWYVLEVKNPGVYRLDMYFFNKDGHQGMNRVRDYMIEIYQSPTKQRWSNGLDWQLFSELAEHQVLKSPPIAKCRIRDFWGGVHKQFVLKGAEYYFVKVRRNYSYNTILSLVAIDRMIGEETFHDRLGLSPWMEEVRCDPPEIPELYTDEKAELARSLWIKTNEVANTAAHVGAYRKAQLTALRAAHHASYSSINEKQLYQALSWHLNQWSDGQREMWAENMKEAWRQFGIRDPAYVKARDEFLANPKAPKIWASNTHKGENGVRIKEPEFRPVPTEWKRRPN